MEGYTTDKLGDFIKLEDDGGGNTLISIDIDGNPSTSDDNTFDASLQISLTGVSYTDELLNNMINNGQLVL